MAKMNNETNMDYERGSMRIIPVLGILTLIAIVVLAAACVGCTSPRDIDIERLDALYDAWWNDYTNKLAKAEAETPPVGETPTPDAPKQDIPMLGDALAAASLNWGFGGFNGAKAAHNPMSDPVISGLSCRNNVLYYKFDRGLSPWGLSHSDAGAVCAAFFEGSDGVWRGGKFDWVSTSRQSREMKHMNRAPHYSNWGGFDWGALKEPKRVAFVIVSKDQKRRSNILIAEVQ